MLYKAPCSAGDLVDRITILEIKCMRLSEEKANIARRELEALEAVSPGLCYAPEIWPLYQMLKRTNEYLWDIEDRVRKLIRTENFGQDFVEVARQIAPQNDHRAAVKRKINDVTGSSLVEMKSHF